MNVEVVVPDLLDHGNKERQHYEIGEVIQMDKDEAAKYIAKGLVKAARKPPKKEEMGKREA